MFNVFLQVMVNQVQAKVTAGVTSEYNVILVLTDGDIHDMRETIATLVRASYLPISVIIVGLGNDSFARMNALDCDGGVLTDSSGNQAI